MSPEEFRFVDTAFGNVNKRNHVMDVAELAAKVASLNGTPDCYASVLRFPKDLADQVRRTGSVRDYPGPAFASCVWFDFDSESEPVRALEDARSLVRRLEDLYDVPEASVNGRLKIEDQGKLLRASAWLDSNRPVEQMTWAPGHDVIIRNLLVSHGGWIEKPGATVFNLYLPPRIERGDASKAGMWLELLEYLYPDDVEHILNWMAHRAQRPNEKINHALVLGGKQGIGKDTLLEPLKYAVGAWNFAEVSPVDLLGRFNPHVKSVVLRVSEARDLGDVDRFALYEHMKVYTAAPPDVLRCDEKNIREHAVFNVCGVILTTNHKTHGIYLPADDRRHFVAWSDANQEDFADDYFPSIWGWYEIEGFRHVAVYLQARDLSGFNAKAPPPKTPAFWEIVDASRAPEDAEFADSLEKLDYLAAVTLADVIDKVTDQSFVEWLRDRRNSRQIPYRFEEAGYVTVRNGAARDGLWKIRGRRIAVYAKATLSLRDRLTAAKALTGSR